MNEPLDVRPARPEDLPEVLDVFHAVDLDTAGETLMDAVDLEGFWADPTLDPERDTRLVRDGGRPVAAAVAFANGFARVDVVPDACGRGLGTQLAQWVEGRQRERGADHCEQEVFGTDVRTRAFLEGRGYVPAHESWSLELPADATIAERPLPDGVVVRPMRPGEELVVHQVVEDAFNEWEGRTPRAFESWKALVLDRPGMTADHLLVAACGDEVLGACVGMDGESADEYWVAQLAVRRDQRGRGIAQQLLAVSYAAARSRGRTRGRLDTDSRTGALSLYERLGMHVTLSFQNLRLDL